MPKYTPKFHIRAPGAAHPAVGQVKVGEKDN